jgi:hypothetical protein
LFGKIGLDGGMAAIAMPDGVDQFFFRFEKPQGFQIGEHSLARFGHLEASVLFRGVARKTSVGIENIHSGQIMPVAHLEIVRIVGWGYFDQPGTEFPIDIRVRDKGNKPVRKRKLEHFPDQAFVTPILGVGGHRRIAQKRFRPGGGDFDPARRAFRARSLGEFVPDVPHRTRFVIVLHFVIRNGRAAGGAPVDQIFAFVDEASLVEADEDLANRPGKPLVQGKALPGPIDAGAYLGQLPEDYRLVFLRHLPGLLDEGFPADIPLILAFLAKLLFDHILGRYSRMVGSGQPKGRAPGHASIAYLYILKAIIERMTKVEHAGYIGRRDYDSEGMLAFVIRRLKAAFALPHAVYSIFETLRIVGLGQFDRLHAIPPGLNDWTQSEKHSEKGLAVEGEKRAAAASRWDDWVWGYRLSFQYSASSVLLSYPADRYWRYFDDAAKKLSRKAVIWLISYLGLSWTSIEERSLPEPGQLFPRCSGLPFCVIPTALVLPNTRRTE